MTNLIIRNSRQFNAVLATAESSNEQITAMLAYAANQLKQHNNKTPIIQLYNSPAWRTKAGKISAKGKPVISYLLSGQSKALQFGVLDNGAVVPFNATTAPDQIQPNMVHNNAMAEGADLTMSFDDFLSRNDEVAKKEKTIKPVSAKAFTKQLQAAIERGITGEKADLDQVSDLIKQALNVLANAYVSDDSATVLAADELAKVKPSAKSRSAGLKVA